MKKILAVLSVLCIFLQAEACSSDENLPLFSETEIPSSLTAGTEKEVPDMQLAYAAGGSTYTINVFPGNSSWLVDKGDGSSSATLRCGFHPLDAAGSIPEIKQAAGPEKINISFSLSPSSLSVRRWKDSCAGNAEKYDKASEIVAADENTIIVTNDGTGYIYEVRAKWPQGEAQYAFYLK